MTEEHNISPDELLTIVRGGVETKVQELIDKAAVWLKMDLTPPQVDFNVSGGRAGTATSDGKKISFNIGMLLENHEDYLKTTIPHEVAHSVIGQVCGPNAPGHGREWRSVMHLFGCTPDRCHNYDVTNHTQERKPRSRYRYKCYCREGCLVGATVDKRIQRQVKVYRCRKCETILTTRMRQGEI